MASFDLNLARTFVLLFETRSVTATADALSVTQPTVSYSLQKLRRRFADELFRRSAAGLVPTVTAERLYRPLHSALEQIDGAVSSTQQFDPARAEEDFTVALSDLGEVTLLPDLLAALAEQAPGVRLRVRPLDVAEAEEQLLRGELDAFVASPLIVSARMVRRPLFVEGYQGMVSVDHPRITGGQVGPAELAAERQVTVFGPTGHVGPAEALERHGLSHRIQARVTRFAGLPYVVHRTELVAIVPTLVGQVLAAANPVRLFELPFPIAPVEVSLYARHSYARTAAQEWLVGFMTSVLSRSPVIGAGARDV